MDKSFSVTVDEDIYVKFQIALGLTKDEQNETIEHFMKSYITITFEKISQIYNSDKKSKTSKEYASKLYGKANWRIPIWAHKPNQYNHKIIRSFFKAKQTTNLVTVAYLEKLCSDKSVPELFVPTFKSNYAQMKIDAPTSHGKVFEDDGKTVTIWSEVEDTLMQYKNYFCDTENDNKSMLSNSVNIISDRNDASRMAKGEQAGNDLVVINHSAFASNHRNEDALFKLHQTENDFRTFLINDPNIISEKAVDSRIAKARKAVEVLGAHLDSVVADDDRMYAALMKLRDNEDNTHSPMQNALRKYYIFKNGHEFPQLKNYHS